MFNFSCETIEVINFKTVHEINQTVFVVKDGEIKTATITGVLFTDFPYQYKLMQKATSYSGTRATFSIPLKMPSRYTERLAARYDADLAKI